MNNKLKGVSALAMMAIITTSIAFYPSHLHADNRVKKFDVLHNGHHICIPQPAVDAHLREHSTDVECGPCNEANSGENGEQPIVYPPAD